MRNDEVLQKIDNDRELIGIIKIRITVCLEDIYRNDKYKLLQLQVEGKIEEKRGSDRR